MSTSLKDAISSRSNFIDIKKSYELSGIENTLSEMNEELIGLDEVKNRVREISSVLLFDKIREVQELSPLTSSLHMAFTGRSGTGKSAVAQKLASVLRNLGYLTKGHIINVTREDLVGQYVGHTAPKTKEQLQKAHGGILFIDEAYHLYKPDNERDYGAEAVELLLQIMENQRDDLILVFSGEKHQIEKFFNANPGISSRIGNHVDFKDYKLEELVEITKFLLLNEYRNKITPKAINILRFYLEQLIKFPSFSNVRTIKILLNQLLSYHSVKVEKILESKGAINYSDLVTINEDDFSYFVKDDFINIIGSEKVNLYSKLNLYS